MKLTGINKKLHFTGASLSFIIIGVILLTVILNEKSKKDSLIINIAGKQRMLSQKMSKEIFYIKHRETTDFRTLDSDVDLFEHNLHDLLYGNTIKGIYPPQNEKITKKLKEVLSIWTPFKAEMKKIQATILKAKSDLEVSTEKTNTLLLKSDNIVKVMVKHDMKGVFIDLSGRQRMLSQRMGLFIERYLRTDNDEDYLRFVKAKNLYDQTLDMFINSSEVKNIPEVNKIVKETYTYWNAHKEYTKNLLKMESSINTSFAYIYDKNVKLLETMDAAVWLYTSYSEEKNSIFIKSQYISLLFGLIIMIYGFISYREIISHINDFVKKTKILSNDNFDDIHHREVMLDEASEDELKEASTYISSFVKKVNVAMNHSNDAIQKAESAIDELQTLTDDVENVLKDLDIDENEKSNFDKKVNATEDIAIESAENLMHVRKMLEKLKTNLNTMVESSNKKSV